MAKFADGEIVVLCNLLDESAKYNGEEVTIIKHIGLVPWRFREGGAVTQSTYLVTAHFHAGASSVAEKCLKKIDPGNTLTTWDGLEKSTGLGWNPTKVTH